MANKNRNWNKNKNNNRGKSGNKPGKNNFQDKFADDERNKGRNEAKYAIETGSSDNDPAWYTPNGQLLKDVATFPYGVATGRPIQKTGINRVSGLTSQQINDYVLPGIMTYYIVPTFGDTTNQTDALNVAMNSFFVSVRRATSGTSYYEAPNLMLYVLATASAASLYSFLLRAYGVMTDFRTLNRYTPEAVITAMGLDYQDLKSNMADFRMMINQFAYKLSSLAVPKDLNYATRQIFLYESIYTDADNEKAQYYMYCPVGFYIYNETDAPTGLADEKLTADPTPHLEFVKFGDVATKGDQATLLKLPAIQEYIDSMLNPLIGSEDIRFMASDIRNAYGANNMIQISPIAETYTVTPVYNREVLSQFENAYIYPGFDQVNVNLYEDLGLNKGYLKSDYRFTEPLVGDAQKLLNARLQLGLVPEVTDVYTSSNILINMHEASVTPEQTMVASRLSSNGSLYYTRSSSGPYLPSGGYLTPGVLASEIVNSAQIWYFWNASSDPAAAPSISLVSTFCCTDFVANMNGISGNPFTGVLGLAQRASLISKFDWNPKWRIISYTTENNQLKSLAASDYIYDQDNFMLMSDVQLQKVNDIAMLGLFTFNVSGAILMK